MNEINSEMQNTNGPPFYSGVFSCAILFIFQQITDSIFPFLHEIPAFAVPLYAGIGAISHLIVASVFLGSDPRIWRENTDWYKKTIAVLEPELQKPAQAVAWDMVAPLLVLNTAILSAVGAAGGAFVLGSGLAVFIALGTFGVVGFILKRRWLDKERQEFTKLLSS